MRRVLAGTDTALLQQEIIVTHNTDCARGRANGSNRPLLPRLFYLVIVAAALSGCVRDETSPADSAGSPTSSTPPPSSVPPPSSAPPPSSPPMDGTPPPVDPNPPMDPPPMTDVAAFEQTLFPKLRNAANFCVSCHGATQIPTFAVADVLSAYNVIVSQQKVNLDNPELSRVYLRPSVDRHNCGGDASCDAIAADFLAGIQAWAQQTPAPSPTQQILMSSKTSFAAGIASGAARADAGVIAMFEFDEGAGDMTFDSSGVSGIALQITGMEWLQGALRNVSGKAQASLADSRKLFDRVTQTGAYTIEAWLIPENTAQDGPARIVSYSTSSNVRNFMMGQSAIYYRFRNRSSVSNPNGDPALEALDPQVSIDLQHVVMTFDEAVGRKIYINGELSIEEDAPATLDWLDDQIFVIGNEVTDNRLWKGVLEMVAVHDKALSAAEVLQNFGAGAGEFITLQFDVSGILGNPARVEMLATQLDPASYVFARPVFVSDATGIRVKNIRIAVDDSIPVAAQVFRRIDTTVTQSGAELSRLGAVIPVSRGREMDQFHLEFEILGGRFGTAESIAPSSPPAAVPDTPEPDFGIRTFSKISDTMASLTGVAPDTPAISTLYADIRDSLPAADDLLSFVPAHQVAIQRLSVAYCGDIVGNATECNAFFGTCSIAANGKTQIADTLYDKLIGTNLANQPDRAGTTNELVRVMNDLGCVNGCTGATAATALQAACAAVLSSAAVTIN